MTQGSQSENHEELINLEMIIEQKTTNCGYKVSWPLLQAIPGPIFQSSSTPNAALNVSSQKGRQQTHKSGLGGRT